MARPHRILSFPLTSGRSVDFYADTVYNHSMKTNKISPLESNRFQFVCKYFLLASAVAFCGWLFETMSFIILWEPSDRGMLTLPFCYLYGSVAVIVWFVLGTPFSGNMGKLFKKLKGDTPSRTRIFFSAAAMILLYFIAVTLLSTLVELIIGLIFIKGMNMPLWGYSNYKHTFLNIICLEFSILWGVLLTLGMCTLWPLFMFLEKKLSPKTRAILAIVLAILVVCDFLFNCIYFGITGSHFDLF